MFLITLSNGLQVKVSKEDFIYLSGFNWNLSSSGYVSFEAGKKQKSMHRLIAERAGIDCQNQIDHKDGNRLNNQRGNLRAATFIENGQNHGKNKNNTSGYKGVSWDKQKEKWSARIGVNKKYVFLGCYDTKEAASFAYQLAAKKYHGEYAYN